MYALMFLPGGRLWSAVWMVVGGVGVLWLLAWFAFGGKKVRVRVGYLTLVVGLRRQGKTLFVCKRASDAIAAGRIVYANFAIEGGHLIETWRDVILAPRGALVLLDEVHQWCPARAGSSLRPAAGWYVAQCGKLDHEVYIIAQHENQVAGIVRDQVNEIIECKLHPLRGHRASSYAPHTFRKKAARPLWTWYYSHKGGAAKVYDTKALVPPEASRGQNVAEDLEMIVECIEIIKRRDGYAVEIEPVHEVEHLDGWLSAAGFDAAHIHRAPVLGVQNANGPALAFPRQSTDPLSCDGEPSY